MGALADPSSDAEFAASFLPRFRWKALAAGLAGPIAVVHSGALLLIDVVGFTAMTDQAVQQGIVGAERLAETVNQWLAGIFRTIEECGGDVYVVAGDAVIAVWFADDESAVAQSVAAALRAGLRVQAEKPDASGRLEVRSSVGFGRITYCETGGQAGAWHAVLAGDVLTELAVINKRATPGTVLASAATWSLVSGIARGTPLPPGAFRVTAVSTGHLAPVTVPRPGPMQGVRGVLPRIVLDWMTTGQNVNRIAQFRTASVMFILLKGLELDADAAPTLLQSAIVAVQSACAEFQGTVYQVLGGELGVSIVVAFGLPPVAHEDDAARAIRAALRCRQTCSESGLTTSIGIATGRAFCCVYGNHRRRQFALVGPVMNLAARLMHASEAEILCDADTVAAVRRGHHLDVGALPPLDLKGKSIPVACFAVSQPPRRAARADDGPLIGRRAELGHFEAALTALRDGVGATVVVEAEPGIGKSALLRHALDDARSRGIRTLVGFAEEIEQSTSYFPWRNIFIEAFGIGGGDTESMTEQICSVLGRDAPLASLLNAILGCRVDETVETQRLSGIARAETTKRILLHQLTRFVGDGPMLLALEDLHWFDSSSWEVLNAVTEVGLPILVAATTRPLGDDAVAFSRLLSVPGCRRHVLYGLERADTGSVVARALAASRTTSEVTSFVQGWTGGNPFFAGELAKVLRSADIVVIVDGQVMMSPDVLFAGADLDGALQARGVPATLEGAIVARLDRLPPAHQLVLRAASVVGRVVELRALTASMPAEAQATLAGDLDALRREGLLVPTHDSPGDEVYEFRHVILRDVAYHGMSFAARRQNHETLARWMEQTEEGRSGRLDSLLGHHFREAGETAKAGRYLSRAGATAVRSYSNKEAASLLTAAMAVVPTAKGVRPAHSARGDLELLLGRAYLALSRNSESRHASETGLARLGYGVPRWPPQVLLGVLRETARQTLYRCRGASRKVIGEDERVALSAIAIALEGLAEIYFYDGDGLKSLYASLKMLNVAEQLGESPELARASTAVSGIAGLLQLAGLATHYRRRSLALLDRLNDPAAAAWSLNLLAISRMGTGHWEDALDLYRRTREIAVPLGERRRTMDAIEGCAIVAACRGEWHAALTGVEEFSLLASRDADQRYLLLAYREQAYLELQVGRRNAVERLLPLIKAEIERGLTAEEHATRQDYHAIAGTLALERGDAQRAAMEADAGLGVSAGLSGSGSYANRYWTMMLIGRIYLILWQRDEASAGSRWARQAKLTHRLLNRLAGAHPIAAPAALLVQGGIHWLNRRHGRARRAWLRASATACSLGMHHEAALAKEGLHLCDANPDIASSIGVGLPLFQTRLATEATAAANE